MTHRFTHTLVATLICGFLKMCLPACLQAQVQPCTHKMQAITDGRLQQAIDELKTRNPNLQFQSDENPCQHASETISALSRTLRRNYLTRLSGYEFVKIINGESYFTVERFKSHIPGDLTRLDAALQRHTPHKFAIEANTRYDVFVAGEGLILMTSSATGYDANSTLFHQLEQTFKAAP